MINIKTQMQITEEVPPNAGIRYYREAVTINIIKSLEDEDMGIDEEFPSCLILKNNILILKPFPERPGSTNTICVMIDGEKISILLDWTPKYKQVMRVYEEESNPRIKLHQIWATDFNLENENKTRLPYYYSKTFREIRYTGRLPKP